MDNPVTIPGGFHLADDSGTSVEEGIVIEDNTENHNQFVWIPVGEYNVTQAIEEITEPDVQDGKLINELSRRTFTSRSATIVSEDSVISYYYYGEGNAKFKRSATTKGGFYIGRYEQGTENVCKAGVDVYTSVTRNTATTQAESMYSGNADIKATTELMTSYAWDTALNFICQTNTDGYELAITKDETKANIGTSNRTQTGAYTADNYSNIHDLLGNCYEWTTEKSSYSNFPYVVRGAYCDESDGYASYRSRRNKAHSDDYLGFRVQLYLDI